MTNFPGNSVTGRRVIDRVRALSRVRLASTFVLAEQVRMIGEAIRTNAEPEFYILESAEVPIHQFQVLLGEETITDELRLALASGFWPGPAKAATPHQLIRRPQASRLLTVTLWGGDERGGWEKFWQERNVRHGLYAVFLSCRGRIGVMLASRGNSDPPFDPADVAFVEGCMPHLEAALDLSNPIGEQALVAAESVHFHFGSTGHIRALSFGAREFLRDLAGGGPGAVADGIAKVEQANRTQTGLAVLESSARDGLILAGSGEERALRSSMLELALRPSADPDRSGASVYIAENAFGRFRFDLSTLVGLDGEFERFGVLTRLVPPLILRLRGAIGVQATGRELELLSALTAADTLQTAADSLQIAKATARTLGERLARRVGETSLHRAADRLLELGRSGSMSGPTGGQR